ncbi:MAG: DUF3089 domain-containing protein [Sphingomonadales bacterium]
MLARRFLWVVAIAIVIVIAFAFAWRLAGDRLLSAALLPKGGFDAAAAGPAFDYRQPQSWAARPGQADNPADWRPAGAPARAKGAAAVFFVPPTAAFDTSHWNGRSTDATTAQRLAGFLRTEASALADAGPLWAPHYRQAVLGSFLAETPADRANAMQARELAYADVKAAFAAFLAAQPKDAPIVLAGHSQGALHLLRLLHEQVAGTPLSRRIVAVYAVGWPVSVAADLPALGLPACTRRDEAGCILSWQSFAEPADASTIFSVMYRDAGYTGAPRAGTAMLCTNPLTGAAGGAAPASANPGSLVPNAALTAGEIVSPGVPARCDARGVLLIGGAPSGYPAFVLPGNNFHVFDYPLFWAAVRQDVAARAAAWSAAWQAR